MIRNDVNMTVQTAEEMLKEQWLLEVIQDEPDLFWLAGWGGRSLLMT